MALIERVKNAWNAFNQRDPTYIPSEGSSWGIRPDRVRFTRENGRSLVTAVYNRIALDAASIEIKHVRLDDNGRFTEEIDSPLNNCFSLEANIDQTGRAFRHDIFVSLLDEGCIAIVPTYSRTNPEKGTCDIYEMRTAKILQWYPAHIRIRAYNEQIGREEEIVIPKSSAAIVENPFYSVMNEPNSIMQRLVRKLNLLDAIDEQSGSNKLDLIIQLPYVIKTEQRRQQAEKRRKDIEQQLAGSKYGIAYTDGTEKVTQLNRSVENNLMKQVEFLMSTLYSQLGMSTQILDGSADEKTMLNYYNRIIEPLVSVVVDACKCKFLTKTARSQRQSIMFFRDPFKLVPVNELAELADKFTRNEILSSNEVRQIIGRKPSDDPTADELRNKNLSESSEQIKAKGAIPEEVNPKGEIQNEE